MAATSEEKKAMTKNRSRSRVTARWKKAGTTGEASGAAVPRAEEAGAAGVASSAALPRAEVACRTPLRQLNSTNANLATWDVYIEHAHVEDYEYVWEGKHRKGQVFKCNLVDVHDPTQYCVGERRKERQEPPNWYTSAMNKFPNGTKFRMSSVKLNMKAKPEFVHTTVKQTVNLLTTKLTLLITTSKLPGPLPQVTCEECLAFRSFQAFDITALITKVSEPRPVVGNKYVRDVRIMDGTVGPGVEPPDGQAKESRMVCPSISVFYTSQSKTKEPTVIQELVAAVGKPIPYDFFGIQAKNYQEFETMRFWYAIVPADRPGHTKGQQLKIDHASITQAHDAGTVVILEKQWRSSEGNDAQFLEKTAQETLCAHLDSMTQRTGIAALDDTPSVWQTNWTFASIMPGPHLTTAGKLWLKLMLQDVSGRVEVRMGEKVALELSSHANKEDFIHALEEGDAVFPTILSVKLVRMIREVQSENEPSEKQSFVNTTVLAAVPQDLTMPRTTTVKQLIPIMRSLKTMSIAILPATLTMLKSTAAYPLQVQYPVPELDAQPCQKVWVLIKAKKK